MILAVINYFRPFELNGIIGKWILGISILLIFISVILSLVLPISQVPKPSGKFSIGTRIYELEDRNRDEKYSSDEEAKREI